MYQTFDEYLQFNLNNLLKQFKHRNETVWKIVKNTNEPGIYVSAFAPAYTKFYRLNRVQFDQMGFIYAYPSADIANHHLIEHCYEANISPKDFSILCCAANVLETQTETPFAVFTDEFNQFWHLYKRGLKSIRPGFNEMTELRKSKLTYYYNSAVLCISVKPLYSIWSD